MGIINIPDTIFDNPTQNDLNPSSLVVAGGRLMSSAPHVDGLYIVGPQGCDVDSANLVKTRNAKGDWSFNRTAAGAETFNIRTNLDIILRLGELYNLGNFGSGNTPAAPPKGVQVIDFFALYSTTVVPLTTATLRLGKTVYSNVAAGGAFVQTDIVAATGIQTAVTPAVNQYAFQKVAGPSPLVFSTDDLGLVEIEAVLVMANTGVLRFAGFGAHVNFNYT